MVKGRIGEAAEVLDANHVAGADRGHGGRRVTSASATEGADGPRTRSRDEHLGLGRVRHDENVVEWRD